MGGGYRGRVTVRDLPAELIRRKRDGATLTEGEIAALVSGIADGAMSEGQVAAFAMAVYFQGMATGECAALTRAMARSGTALEWSAADLEGPILDKHSTGGVGDKVSLILAPMVAACGGFVPMISGRGLGHTGGTLDKLASIPGYETAPSISRLQATVVAAGCAIVGPTAEIAPADRRLYAIRDVTATVDSIPLITASILSKKLAEGLDALVIDVKVGSGALIPSFDSAIELADSLRAVSEDTGLRTAVLLTDMAQVLGRSVGNALEVSEAIDVLIGRGCDGRLREVAVALASELVLLGGLARDLSEGAALAERSIASGAAAERFARMVAALGGPADLLDRPDRYLRRASVQFSVRPDRAGVVSQVDARGLALAVVGLGGGRRRVDDAIDVAVGLSDIRGIGDDVSAGRPLAVVHARSAEDALVAAAQVKAAMTVGSDAPPIGSPILRRFAGRK
jgi:thymidine phosphorylase